MATDEASVILVFEAPHVHHRVQWSDPAPLFELSHEDFRNLSREAKKASQ